MMTKEKKLAIAYLVLFAIPVTVLVILVLNNGSNYSKISASLTALFTGMMSTYWFQQSKKETSKPRKK